jgi:O-antigen/teichoic acid export membrane protein
MSLVETPSQPVAALALHVGGKVLARNTLLNVAGQVIPLLVGFATMPYVIRHLGPDRFGLLSLAWIVVGYFALFDLGIGPATTKFVAELLGKGDIEKLPALVWTALGTQSGMGLVAGLLLNASAPRWGSQSGPEWLWRFFPEALRRWRRVFVYGPQFVALSLLELAGRKKFE